MRNGFIQALRKWQGLSDDPGLLKIMKEKQRLTKLAYRQRRMEGYLAILQAARASVRAQLDRRLLWRFH